MARSIETLCLISFFQDSNFAHFFAIVDFADLESRRSLQSHSRDIQAFSNLPKHVFTASSCPIYPKIPHISINLFPNLLFIRHLRLNWPTDAPASVFFLPPSHDKYFPFRNSVLKPFQSLPSSLFCIILSFFN